MKDPGSLLKLGLGVDAVVLIPHYDCARLLHRAVESVLEQSHKRFVVAIVDDSSKNKADFLEVRNRVNDIRVLWLTTSCNVGQFRIYNHLLPLIHAPYIMLQDADDFSSRKRLEVLLTEIESHNYQILGSAMVRHFAKGHSEVQQFPRDVNSRLHWYRRRNVFCGSTMIVRTEFLRMLHGFDGCTKIAGDTELICRAVFAGEVRNHNEPLYHYGARGDSLTQASDTNFGSHLRRAYVRQMHARFYANVVRRELGKLQPWHLWGAPSDIWFTTSEV